jgi:hypothetical protein
MGDSRLGAGGEEIQGLAIRRSGCDCRAPIAQGPPHSPAAARIHRIEALELYALDRDWLAGLAARLARRMAFSLTVAEQHVYLSLGKDTFPCVIERIAIGRA